MTKFKEYLRAKGIKLECDYEVLPHKNLEAVKTSVTDGCVMATAYFNTPESWSVAYNKRGECVLLSSYDDQVNPFCVRCDLELMDWLYDNGFTDQAVNHWMIHYSPIYSSYSVYVAYLHVRAGIMDEAAFYKLVNKRCQQAITF